MSKKRGKSRRKRKDRRRFTAILVAIFALLALQSAIDLADGDLYKISRSVADVEVSNVIEMHGAEPPESMIPTSVFNIHHEYKENEVAANNRYKGKPIGIIGTVKSVGVDNDDHAIVNLKVPFSFNSLVSARGGTLFTKKSADLKRGQQAVMICIGDGIDMELNIPKLSECKLYTKT
ncbi:MAG: hypothetical protein VYA60_10715 [Pseudomonadota bacterium]|nr:hypothetical protein [Pseudomonadota bacterium]